MGMTLSAVLKLWSNEFEDALSQNGPLCVAVFSLNRELLFVNTAFRELLLDDFFASLMNPSFEQIVKMASREGEVFCGFLTLGDYNTINTSIVVRMYKKDKQILIVGGTNASQLLEQNMVMHQINREVSSLQRELIKKKFDLEIALSELEKSNIELRKIDEDRTRFMQILSHDLRSPFNAMIGFSDLLLTNFRSNSEEVTEQQLTFLNKTANKTFDMLNDLLMWSKAQAGKISFQPKELELQKVIDSVRITVESSTKKINFVTTVQETCIVFADVDMLKTILRNLVSNAVKFTHENGTVQLQVQHTKEYVNISVIDNGVGMADEALQRLWNFTKPISQKGTNGEAGTGFGLQLCKEFVERHNGQISATSKLGEGSSFSFTLPSSSNL